MAAAAMCFVVAAAIAVVVVLVAGVHGGEVTYDGRSLIINGTRKVLFSGSIHYPRSTPEMWPSLVSNAKRGGIDVIQTYVFWNVHEPIQGQYNFEGSYDLVKFIKVVRDQGLYVNLRIGPFIEAEWKYGGLPFWLHYVPGIVFRSDNEPFKFYMQKFVTMIVNMMKSEGLYASQGGPIILSQIENEYANVEAAFHEHGPPYVRWAASMAVGLQTGVPWTMCKQDDAPDPVINTCNSLKCGETTFSPNSPNKPSLWTENWTTVYTKVGEEPRLRSAEDIAFHVALFIAAKNGSFINYYMYHGGTNFGRSASAFTTTAYYDYAPLDEYGFIRQPKWGHLKRLHAAVKKLEHPLLWGRYTNFSLGGINVAHVFEETHGNCAAFLVNNDERNQVTVKFRNNTYTLPKKSISLLSGCSNVIFNSAKITAGNTVRSSATVQRFDDGKRWASFSEGVCNFASTSITAMTLLEQMTVTKDNSDYLWYTNRYNQTSENTKRVLRVESQGHIIHAFINDVLVGSQHGNPVNQSVTLERSISLKGGQNNISLLSVMVGLPDSGAFMERKKAGVHKVKLTSEGSDPIDLTNNMWAYQVGLLGEMKKIYTEEDSGNVNWSPIKTNSALTWYKTTFDEPSGSNPVALNLTSMGKGEAWINGQSIGRYWVSFKTPKGRPAQALYHIPRSFLKQSGNLLVLFEEEGGDPLQVTLEVISVHTVKGLSLARKFGHLAERNEDDEPSVHLQCHSGKTISRIVFKDYGNTAGDRQNYAIRSCYRDAYRTIFEKFCLDRADCSIPTSALEFGSSPCPGNGQTLLVGATCA